MSNELANVTEALIAEIGRYLAAIDLFRAEGCEPTWQSECTMAVVLERSLSDPREHRHVH